MMKQAARIGALALGISFLFISNNSIVAFNQSSGELYTLKFTITNPRGDVNDGFANNVVLLDSNLIATGASQANVGANESGVVHFFDATTGGLSLTVPNPAPFFADQFGHAVAPLIGGRLAVGMPGDARTGIPGEVFVFDSNTGAALLNIPNPDGGTKFGLTLGSTGNDVLTSTEQVGVVYRFDGATGQMLPTFRHPLGQSVFGDTIVARGNGVVIGAAFTDTVAVDAGEAYVFDLGTAAHILTLQNPEPDFRDMFGRSIAILGNNILVGAPGESERASPGVVYLFNGSTGALIDTIQNPNPASFDFFGQRIGVDGDRILISAPGADIDGINDVGIIYIFDAATRQLLGTIENPLPSANAFFGGTGLSIGDNEVLASATNPRVIYAFGLANTAPVAKCLDVTVSAESNCTASPSIDNGSFDPDGDTITITQDPPGPYSIGATLVTMMVTDSKGASASCTATVTVNDTADPVIICAPDISVTAEIGESGAAVMFSAPAVSDCSNTAVICSPPSGSVFPIGATPVSCTATDSPGNQAVCGFTVAVSGTLIANRDTFLRNGADDTNEGANERLRIQSSGHNRVVVGFNLQGISTSGLQSATLILNIAENADNWGNDGRLVDAHRLVEEWAEGNGRNAIEAGPGFRGTGAGATWRCARDSDISNQSGDCSNPWNGGVSVTATGAGNLHTRFLTGDVSWDVTADVLTGADFGWLIKKRDEGQQGQVRYYSREGATLAGNVNLAPRLVLVYAP